MSNTGEWSPFYSKQFNQYFINFYPEIIRTVSKHTLNVVNQMMETASSLTVGNALCLQIQQKTAILFIKSNSET